MPSTSASVQLSSQRLNKFISDTGVCSRREADRLIESGQVRVNGKVANVGMQVTEADFIVVGKKPLRAKPAPVYLAYNKPVGVISTTDSEVPENIVDAVNYRGGRIFPIGRLDKPSEGLILLTNDGDIVNKILRAGNAHDKEYLVWVDKPLTPEFIRRMAAGVPILGQITQPCPVRQLTATSFNIILQQGLNRQIRRMAEYLGYQVTRLKRVRIMNISLGGLQPGQWRLLHKKELAIINAAVANSSSEAELASPITAAPKTKLGAKRTTPTKYKTSAHTTKPAAGRKANSNKTKSNKTEARRGAAQGKRRVKKSPR